MLCRQISGDLTWIWLVALINKKSNNLLTAAWWGSICRYLASFNLPLPRQRNNNCGAETMSHSIASSRALQGALRNLPMQQCRRCFSSGAFQPKQLRPVLPRSPVQSRQPITQKRTKYKTIEQAKSRYSTGVWMDSLTTAGL